MNFIEYIPKSPHRHWFTGVSVSEKYILISKLFRELLGDPKFVKILYDPVKQEIGVRPHPDGIMLQDGSKGRVAARLVEGGGY